MGKTVQVLEIVLPVIAMLCLGIVTRKKQIITDHGVADMKSLLINICIPAIIFKTFYSTVFTWRMVCFLLIMTAVTAAAYFIGMLAKRLLRIEQEVAPYLCTSIEGAMIGFALFSLLFGEENLYHVALMDLGNAVILFPILATRLRLRTQENVTGKMVARSLVTPINVAIAAGILFSVTGLGTVLSASNAGAVLDSILSFMNGPTSAVILIVIGYGLVFRNVRWAETLKTIFSRIVIFAVLGVIAFMITGWLFPDDILYRYAIIMAFVLPPSYSFSAFIKGDKEEESYVGSVLALYTIVTIIGYVVLAWISA